MAEFSSIFKNVYIQYVSVSLCSMKEYLYILVTYNYDLLAHSSVDQQFRRGSAILVLLILSGLPPEAVVRFASSRTGWSETALFMSGTWHSFSARSGGVTRPHVASRLTWAYFPGSG